MLCKSSGMQIMMKCKSWWNANHQAVHSPELVLIMRKNGSYIIQGCNGELRSQQIVRHDAACMAWLVRQCTPAFENVGCKTQWRVTSVSIYNKSHNAVSSINNSVLTHCIALYCTLAHTHAPCACVWARMHLIVKLNKVRLDYSIRLITLWSLINDHIYICVCVCVIRVIHDQCCLNGMCICTYVGI